MLHTPDRHTNNILKLADFIESLPPEKYIQHCFTGRNGEGHCICGWAIEQAGYCDHSNTERARQYLGITGAAAERLFEASPLHFIIHDDTRPTPKDAARVLRHLAVTGQVDWNITRKEPVDA